MGGYCGRRDSLARLMKRGSLMYFRFRWILVAFACVGSMFLLPMVMIGDVQSIAVDPAGGPLILGDGAIYTIIYPPTDNPDNFYFQYQCMEGGTPGPLQPVPANQAFGGTITYTEQTVGIYTVVGTEVNQIFMGANATPTLVPSSKSIMVQVKGPDKEVITAGLNQDSTPGTGLLNGGMINEVHFSLFVGDKPLGPGWSGYVEERIQHPQAAGIPNIDPSYVDSGYMGGSNDPNSSVKEFYWDPNLRAIVDVKVVGIVSPAFSAGNMGDVIDDFWQQNRLTALDCTDPGNPQIYYMPPHHFQKIKTGYGFGASWKLVEVTQ